MVVILSVLAICLMISVVVASSRRGHPGYRIKAAALAAMVSLFGGGVDAKPKKQIDCYKPIPKNVKIEKLEKKKSARDDSSAKGRMVKRVVPDASKRMSKEQLKQLENMCYY